MKLYKIELKLNKQKAKTAKWNHFVYMVSTMLAFFFQVMLKEDYCQISPDWLKIHELHYYMYIVWQALCDYSRFKAAALWEMVFATILNTN